MLLVTFCIFSIFPGTWNIFFLSFKCAVFVVNLKCASHCNICAMLVWDVLTGIKFLYKLFIFILMPE